MSANSTELQNNVRLGDRRASNDMSTAVPKVKKCLKEAATHMLLHRSQSIEMGRSTKLNLEL